MQDPVSSVDDMQLSFLGGIVDWLDAWGKIDISSGSLTKEAHSALRLTCYSLVELLCYCLEELHFKYVLLGKFQTDALEDRFGWYCQLEGAQYDISVRQLFKCEEKLRLQKVLTFPHEDTEFGDVTNPDGILLPNGSVSPLSRTVYRWHKEWRAVKFRPVGNPLPNLLEKVAEYAVEGRRSREPILEAVSPGALGLSCAIKELEECRDMVQVPATAQIADASGSTSERDVLENILKKEGSVHSVFKVTSTFPLILEKDDMLGKMSMHKRIFYEMFVKKSIHEVLEISTTTKGQAAVARLDLSYLQSNHGYPAALMAS
ncbi:hypothetical protein HPB50_012787 [Hyalomma asiaticum]|uniref:Uncharacterized protein n=1 Tax=Hyalomma asiaticum TaxID=266040 RepID=A0ACB7SGY9_HYAAI|nr:hypothetical protein HPB50_012787 [Hyalomma asiaticum]